MTAFLREKLRKAKDSEIELQEWCQTKPQACCAWSLTPLYLFGWSTWPEEAASSCAGPARERALVWRANYHPDGGQLFYPLNG